MLSINVLLLLIGVSAHAKGALVEPSLCVFKSGLEECRRIEKANENSETAIKCIKARDNIECLELLSEHRVSIFNAEPEEMYVAEALQQERKDFMRVHAQIRSVEKQNDEFQYEVVAVVRNELKLGEDVELQGLKSCHSGMDISGYDIPFTGLFEKRLLDSLLNNRNVSQRENELESLSSLFSQACLAGEWSPDPTVDKLWKSKYSNLCQLCQHPEKCNHPDDHSGDEGSLKCLTKKGDIGWAKLESVKKFFGINGAPTENNPSLYSYLCPDMTKVPLTKTPCTWGGKPWPGFLGASYQKKNIEADAEHYKKVILHLSEQNDPKILKLLGLKKKEKLIFLKNSLTPKEYLQKGQYYDVIARMQANPARKMVMLVLDKHSGFKCRMMEFALYIRGIRPPLQCRKAESIKNLDAKISNINSIMFVADPEEALIMERDLNMKPILHEVYGKTTQVEMVVIVQNDTSIKNFNDIKGKTACLPRNNTAAFKLIVKYMLDNKLIQKDRCPYETAMKEFFKGVKYASVKENKCSQEESDSISCLFCGGSDVAIIPLELAKTMTQIKKESVDVLCPNGVLKPSHEAKDCALFKLPPRMVMVKKDIPSVQEYEIKTALTQGIKLFNEHPEYFKLFGEYKEKHNILFMDNTTNLEPIVGTVPSYETYKSTAINYCETK